MAGQQWVRLNLASSVFPFMTEFDGRSIIQPGLDQNYNYIDQIGEPVKDRGIPQAIYMHNVMPTSQGYQAVGYDLVPNSTGTTAGPQLFFDSVFKLVSTAGAGFGYFNALYSPCNMSNVHNDFMYTFTNTPRSDTTPWVPNSNPRVATATDSLVTTAFVQGSSYIAVAGNHFGVDPIIVYRWDPANLHLTSLTTVTLGGLNPLTIRGICGANGYLIAWDGVNNIAWSNQTNPLDFVPAVATGAGGGSIGDVRGSILFCLPITGGFIIYCTENMVGATYTGNSQFPFAFKEIIGSAGVGLKEFNSFAFTSANTNSVAFENNLPYHYAYTSSGMQQITLNSATGIFPEVSDFLGKRVFEDFDEVNNVLVETPITNTLAIKLHCLASRYLIISYADPTAFASSLLYTHALVFDSVLVRWGKLKIPHTAAIEFINTVPVNGADIWVPADYQFRNIAFVQRTGAIYTLNMELNSPTCTIPVNGVLIFGKVQSSRNKFIAHQRTDIEDVNQGDTFSAYVIPSLDGKTLQPAQIMSNPPNLIINAAKMKRMALKVTCQNFCYLFKGAFNLVSLLLDYTQEGHR